jgi:O-antigen ligase
MKDLITLLNSVSENVWGVLLIVVGAGVGVAGIKNPALQSSGVGIITAGAAIFKGGTHG